MAENENESVSTEEQAFEQGFGGVTEATEPTAEEPTEVETVEASETSTEEVQVTETETAQPPTAGSEPVEAEQPAAPRDWNAEWTELAKAYPEITKQPLPQDIFEECMKSTLPPVRVYERMMVQKMRSENEELRKENETLKQNAEKASRAPVRPTVSAVKEAPVDDFMRGFNQGRNN